MPGRPGLLTGATSPLGPLRAHESWVPRSCQALNRAAARAWQDSAAARAPSRGVRRGDPKVTGQALRTSNPGVCRARRPSVLDRVARGDPFLGAAGHVDRVVALLTQPGGHLPAAAPHGTDQ